MRFLRDVSKWGCVSSVNPHRIDYGFCSRKYQMPPTRGSNVRLELLSKCHKKPQVLTLAVFCSLLFEGNQNPSFRRGAHI